MPACVNPGSWASMGLSVPAAAGATLANPDRPVVALTGEGGLMMCLEELHTIVAESLDVTVFLLDNDDYAIISEEAERSYGLDEMAYGWRDAPLSLTDIAAGMCVETERVETADAVERAVSAAIEADEPRLVSVPTDPTEPQASEWFAGEE